MSSAVLVPPDQVPTTLEIKVSLIRPRANARPSVPARVSQLAESIRDIGLQSPIVVRSIADSSDGKLFEILSGRHRHQAFVFLNKEQIPAIVRDVDDLHAELIEIDENLCRENLTPAQMTAAVARRKQIYEALHPETAHGGDRRSSRRTGNLKQNGTAKRFTKATAEATGRSERNIQRAARQGEKIGPEDLERLAGTSLDKVSELEALADLRPDERRTLIDKAASGETVSARISPKSLNASDRWRADMSRLIESAPTVSDCAWASDQLARKQIAIAALEVPEFLRRAQ
jgi:ParB family chromosome partitioning protein